MKKAIKWLLSSLFSLAAGVTAVVVAMIVVTVGVLVMEWLSDKLRLQVALVSLINRTPSNVALFIVVVMIVVFLTAVGWEIRKQWLRK